MLVQVAGLAERSEGFLFFLKDPTIPKKQKARDVASYLADLKVSDTTASFFGE